MERLTEPAIGCFKFDFKELSGKHAPGEFGTYEAFWAYSMLCKRLGEYEDTNLTPEEIEAMKQENAELKAIREQEGKYTERLSKDLSIHKKALLGISTNR